MASSIGVAPDDHFWNHEWSLYSLAFISNFSRHRREIISVHIFQLPAGCAPNFTFHDYHACTVYIFKRSGFAFQNTALHCGPGKRIILAIQVVLPTNIMLTSTILKFWLWQIKKGIDFRQTFWFSPHSHIALQPIFFSSMEKTWKRHFFLPARWVYLPLSAFAFPISWNSGEFFPGSVADHVYHYLIGLTVTCSYLNLVGLVAEFKFGDFPTK